MVQDEAQTSQGLTWSLGGRWWSSSRAAWEPEVVVSLVRAPLAWQAGPRWVSE